MLLAFCDFKLHKWDALEKEAIELFVNLRPSPLSFLFMSQTEFTALETFLINREVPLLFKCDLLLLRQVLSMLLLFIKIMPLLLHKFSSFVLISLILSSKSWSSSMSKLCHHRCRTLWWRRLFFLFFEEYLHYSGYHLLQYE